MAAAERVWEGRKDVDATLRHSMEGVIVCPNDRGHRRSDGRVQHQTMPPGLSPRWR